VSYSSIFLLHGPFPLLIVHGEGVSNGVQHLRAGSHYGQRSRGRRFPPIKLQETKSLASRPFTLWPKSKGRHILNDYFLKKAMDSRRKFGLDGNGNPNYGREAVGFFSLNNQSWACSFEFGLWAWPLEASHFGRPSREAVRVHGQRLDFALGLWRLHTLPSWRLRLLYFIGYVFSAHFFGLSLDSQQSLATQSHGLSTWTALVW
jgi:hypothetical protein